MQRGNNKGKSKMTNEMKKIKARYNTNKDRNAFAIYGEMISTRLPRQIVRATSYLSSEELKAGRQTITIQLEAINGTILQRRASVKAAYVLTVSTEAIDGLLMQAVAALHNC